MVQNAVGTYSTKRSMPKHFIAAWYHAVGKMLAQKLNQHSLDLIERDVIASAVIELGGAG
jgi:hypothetical protein